MNYRKSLIPALVLGLSIVLFAGPASAWEFTMDGVYTWQYEVRGQMGSNGFFGQTDSAQSSGIGADVIGMHAPYNFYIGGFHKGSVSAPGVTVFPAAYGGQGSSLAGGESIVSGSDAGWNIIYMSTNMQIRMNQALRIRGNYFIGSWNSPNYSTSQGLMVSSGMLNQDAPGVQRSFSPGYWRTLWLSAQLPWGELAIGKRPSMWGMGLTYGGDDNRHSDSLSLTTFYGPFRIGISLYPSRRGYGSNDYTATGAPTTQPTYYNERPDKNNTRAFDMTIPNVTYRSGPIDAGFYWNPIFYRRGGESVIANPTTTTSGTRGIQSRDFQENYGGAYFKYNNGRFFLNAEYEFDRVIEDRIGNLTTATGNQVPPLYTNFDAGAVEAGVLAGPAKVSVIGAWFTGDDYRYGTRQGTAEALCLVATGKQSDTTSNTGMFRPYSYLMIYGYGLGTSFAKDTGNGFVQDASVYAARLDYAAAANLNIYGSFTWAEKFSRSGDLWGCLRPVPLTSAAAPANTYPAGKVVYLNANYGSGSGAGSNNTPTIPDNALGYEFDAGFDWKLLEGLTARCTVGYWVPGKWFSYACVDKNIPNWGLYTAGSGSWANNFFTNPGKTIDPIWGMEFKVEGSF